MGRTLATTRSLMSSCLPLDGGWPVASGLLAPVGASVPAGAFVRRGMRSTRVRFCAIVSWAMLTAMAGIVLCTVWTWSRIGVVSYIRGPRVWIACSYRAQFHIMYNRIYKDDAHFTGVVMDPEFPGLCRLRNDAMYQREEVIGVGAGNPDVWQRPTVLRRSQEGGHLKTPMHLLVLLLPFATEATWYRSYAWPNTFDGKTMEPGLFDVGCIGPLWAPWLLCGAVLWLASGPWRKLRRMRRRLARGCCAECGYDLRAHQAGEKCPECGRVIGEAGAGNSEW
jgi:hypothetical protein